MAHQQQADFCLSVRSRWPDLFRERIVVDIGSLDINGNNQFLFEDSLYIGVDLAPGRNVDLVSKAHELRFPDESIDTIISTECFEHDQYYVQSLRNIVRMLKPGGLLAFTCATTGRPEHGTRRTTPADAPFVGDYGSWGDYYKNLEESDIRAAIDVPGVFEWFEFSVNDETHDLYFWGVKKGASPRRGDYSFLLKRQGYLVENQKLASQVRDLQSERDELASSRDLLLGQLARATAEMQRYEAQWRRADSDIRALLATHSWRLTSPLRLLGLLARGEFRLAAQRVGGVLERQLRKLSPHSRSLIVQVRTWLLGSSHLSPHTDVKLHAITPMVRRRGLPVLLPQESRSDDLPQVDVTVVMHKNGKWLPSFVESVAGLDYPRDLLNLTFIDHESGAATLDDIGKAVSQLKAIGIRTQLINQPNRGFGAGHDTGIRAGAAPFCLVTNVDLTFEPSSLRTIVRTAMLDDKAAAWEFRQKPYEHPKYYDPVTFETNWNSHACVLLRRAAYERVGGYDTNIFMYGEDVELSYRLRRAGWLLRYCPGAVVYHYSYQSAGEVKPIQYVGSTFANLYLRLKYGRWSEVAIVPLMALGLIAAPQPFEGARRAVAKSMLRLARKAPFALGARRRSPAVFPFRLWDYELTRDGAFHPGEELPAETPLVSVITRTYRGRGRLLREAILSVGRQTYPNIELIVVEDGGETLRETAEAAAREAGIARLRFLGRPKAGRSATGNAGLAAADGRWCLFLDDDDLLFADHVEMLVDALLKAPESVASYSLAWEVQTHYSPADPDHPYTERAYDVVPSMRQAFDRNLLTVQNYIAIESCLFERDLFVQRGGFDEDMDALEDWVLWNVYAHGNVFTYVPKITSLFRTPDELAVRAARNEIFAANYDKARARFVQRIADLSSSVGRRADLVGSAAAASDLAEERTERAAA